MEIPEKILEGILKDEGRGWHDWDEFSDDKRPVDKLVEFIVEGW